MEDRRIGDMQVAMRYRQVHRFNDMVRGGMHRWQHMRQFMEIAQILNGRQAAFIIKVTQIGRPGHGNKNRRPSPQLNTFFGVAGVERDFRRDRFDQRADQPAIKVDPFALHLGTGPFPVFQRNGIGKGNANLLQDIQ